MPRIDNGIDGYQGGSNRVYMGRANLINPHLQYITPRNIASSLVHEAIHICLYKIELWQIPCRSIEELYKPCRISPWTGQVIHLLAFIHASFVWFGLLNIWKMIVESSGDPDGVAKYYIETAQAGFDKPEYKLQIESHRDILNENIAAQLLQMYKAN
jgi:hypothetical protein